MRKKSQNEKIKNHLEKGLKLTSLQALKKFGSFRLASRISDLRSYPHNMNIITESVKTKSGAIIARYRLVKYNYI